MGDPNNAQAINTYWGREGLGQAILDALVASGKNLDALTIDDLAPTDQFHGGGLAATLRLARLAGLSPGTRVLDVGGGLGGPARTLAVEFGCHVAVMAPQEGRCDETPQKAFYRSTIALFLFGTGTLAPICPVTPTFQPSK